MTPDPGFRGATALRRVAIVLVVASVMATSGCERERRDFQAPPSTANVVATLRLSDIVPGRADAPPQVRNPYEDNAFAVAEGKRLFSWMNCSGCHGEGGGGSGPALMDDVWIYGSEPGNVYATIVQGRPNGMPSFGTRLTEQQVWQLAAYVRSMSGQLRKDVAPSRNDGLQAKPAENRMLRETPRDAATPPASEHP